MKTFAGFVGIIGNPNAGKSTLMNALMGQKLCIATPKVQTTRHRIVGVLNEGEYQLVFNDTPGIMQTKYKLHERMMDAVNGAVNDCDVLLLIVDVNENIQHWDTLLEVANNTTVPKIIIINKTDSVTEEKVMEVFLYWQSKGTFASIITISALKSKNIAPIVSEIKKILPEAPWFYEADTMTDRNERFFASELIREKIFMFCSEEIPYNCEVIIDTWKEKEGINVVFATVFCGRETHKSILIGKGGSMLKRIATEARKDIEAMTEVKCFLDITIKVKENWRENDKLLRQLGY